MDNTTGNGRTGRTIKSWSDLTKYERQRVTNLVLVVKRTAEPGIEEVSRNDTKSWFLRALDGWDDDWVPTIGSIPHLSVKASCLIIGKFARDLPAGANQLNEQGISVAET